MFMEMGIALQVVDASERFFSNLEGVTDPEEKRKVIGEQFIRVFEEEQSGVVRNSSYRELSLQIGLNPVVVSEMSSRATTM